MTGLMNMTWRELFLSLALTAALLGTASTFAAPVLPADIMNTVRPMADEDGDTMCSAVVVQPGVAYSAKHCGSSGRYVDGLPIDSYTVNATSDAMIVKVPGLACPCAVFGGDARVGEVALFVGFPYRGENIPMRLEVTGPGTVTATGRTSLVHPSFADDSEWSKWDFVITVPGRLIGGQSGGGTFVERGGRWVLVGINSIGLCATRYTTCSDTEEVMSGSVPLASFPK